MGKATKITGLRPLYCARCGNLLELVPMPNKDSYDVFTGSLSSTGPVRLACPSFKWGDDQRDGYWDNGHSQFDWSS